MTKTGSGRSILSQLFIKRTVFITSLCLLATGAASADGGLNALNVDSSEIVYIGKTDAVTISNENSGGGGTSYQLGGVGLITDGEMAGIELSVVGPGVLSFDWKVSSEEDWDVLSYYEVGVGATNQISGTGGDWEHVEKTLHGDSDTVHTFRWEYEKDPVMEYVGFDCGWVDAIKWEPPYMLSVTNGSGSGSYLKGSQVIITADPDPMYMEFSNWNGEAAQYLEDPFSKTTTFTVPSGPSSVTANYAMSIARLAGCYGRTFTESGIEGGVTMNDSVVSPSGTPVVQLGGSGVIPDNGFTAFETVVSGSGSITFMWKVSSEINADYLKFFVDGSEIEAISGTKVPWAQVTNRVEGAGVPHTLRWEYVKNDSLSSSTDAGWVDDIVWIGDVPDPMISPDIRTTAVNNSVFSLSFLGERGMPYTVYSNAVLSANGWVPMDITPFEMGETNGQFRFLFDIMRPLNQSSCFYNVVAAPSEYTVTFVNWDSSVLKTEQVVQGASATAPAVNPTRPSDAAYHQYAFTGWHPAFNNVQSELTVTAQYSGTHLPAPDGMVLIPAGTNSGTDPYYGAYSLTVDAFCMDKYEVTKSKWDVVRAWAIAHGYSFSNGSGKAANHPVHTVNWYDCVKWCNARSEMDGREPCYTVSGSVYRSGQSSPTCNFSADGYRLPTNTEWSYAARGGLSGKRFPWGDTITHSQANYISDSYSYDISPTRGYHPAYNNGNSPYTSPVGSFAANGYGLYDMSGNVWEWCNDTSGSYRCIRGGCWYSFAYNLRCGGEYEYWRGPGNARNNYGFRAVCR